jgi:hypothetical protein
MYLVLLVYADLQLFAEYITCILYPEYLSGSLGDYIFLNINHIKRIKHWNESLLNVCRIFKIMFLC